jgi:ribokinase
MEGIIEGSSYLLLQLEINIAAVEEAVRIAAAKGVPVILNPAPFQRISDEVLEMVTYLTPNESEAALLLGENKSDLTSQEMCDELFARYKTRVIVTVGSEGAVYRTPEGFGRAPCRGVKACDTTGAGDTFNAALAVALTEGKPLESALDFANAAAGISVTRHGVVPSIPFRKEVDRILEGK